MKIPELLNASMCNGTIRLVNGVYETRSKDGTRLVLGMEGEEREVETYINRHYNADAQTFDF